MLFGIEKTLFRYEDNGGYKDTVHFEKYFSTRYEKWMVFNLAFLFMAAAVGGIYSGKFFSDTDVKYIPGQSPAQCFVLIAVCPLSHSTFTSSWEHRLTCSRQPIVRYVGILRCSAPSGGA